MAGVVDHATHLAFSAFMDRDLDPGIRLLLAELSYPGGRRLAVLEKNALFEHLDVPVLQEALDLHQVGLGQFMLRMGDEVSKVPVVRHQEQALGVIVEPAHGIDTDPDALQEISDDRASLGVRHGRNETGRFIQHDIGLGLFRIDQFAVDLDVVPVRVGLGAKLRYDLAVHPHTPLEDDLLGGAARCDTSR